MYNWNSHRLFWYSSNSQPSTDFYLVMNLCVKNKTHFFTVDIFGGLIPVENDMFHLIFILFIQLGCCFGKEGSENDYISGGEVNN